MGTNPGAMLAIIGGGTMGRAIMAGAIRARLLAPAEIVVCEPDVKKREDFSRWGVTSYAAAEDALARLAPAPRATEEPMGAFAFGGQILLAVKPQSLDEAARAVRASLERSPRVVISILAGTPTERVARLIGEHNPVVRAMPNTPARLGKGMTALCRGSNAAPTHGELAEALFRSLGEIVHIDESLMDAFTAVAGSGPAYVFHLAEAMMKGAVEAGFDRITADRMVRQTVLGAGTLLAESTEPPETLRAQVTSKGGTTEAAAAVLEHARVADAVVAAIIAARDRGRELAG